MNLKALASITVIAIGLGACTPASSDSLLANDASLPSLDTLMRMAGQAEAAGQDGTAVSLYRRAHDAYPFDSAPLTAWGMLANRVGAPEQAIGIFTGALAMDENDAGARRGLANAYASVDRPEEALVLYDEVIEWDPDDHHAWNGKGVALDLLARHVEAQAAYRSGLAFAPDDPELTDNLGISLALSGDANAAGTSVVAVAGTGLVKTQEGTTVVRRVAAEADTRQPEVNDVSFFRTLSDVDSGARKSVEARRILH